MFQIMEKSIVYRLVRASNKHYESANDVAPQFEVS